MASKNITFLVLGVILGGALGYGANIVYPPLGLLSTSRINYRVEYEELLQQHQMLVSQLENITGQYENLQKELINIVEEFEVLTTLYETLTEERDALMREYNETQQDYEALLMHFELSNGAPLLAPEPVSNDTIRKDYVWTYDGETYVLSLPIPEHLYLYYRNRTRVPTEDYSVYVTHPHDDEYLTTIIDRFDAIAAEEGYDDEQEVNLVISFVQSLPYTSDNVTTSFDEYPRYPLETLVDGGGDCEDTSILTAALLDAMGHDIVLLNLPDHMAVGVRVEAYGAYWAYEGSRYYYLETTGEGWEIGELPDEYEGETAYVYPLLPTPIFSHDWTATRLGRRLTLVAEVRNVGTGDARGLKLYAAFDAGGDQVWNPVESAFFNLGVEEETTVQLKLDVPSNEYTRVIVYILDPWGEIMDESYSEWFDTG